MKNKNIVIIVVLAIILIISGITAYLTLGGGETLQSMGVVKSEYKIKFYSDDSQVKSIQSQIETYRTNTYLNDDVNNETVKWIESFDNNEYVMVSGGTGMYHLIMKRADYDTLKTNVDTSELSPGFSTIEYFLVTIKANMVETKSLGGGYRDIIYINNIDFVNKVKETS
jgi:hypothetical protein